MTNTVEREMDLYQKQIKYLDEQVERYQLKCKGLQEQNKDLVGQLRLLETNKKASYECLVYRNTEKGKEMEELVKRLDSQRQANQQHREAMQRGEEKHQQLLAEIEELESKSSLQGLKMEEQQEQLMQVRADMVSLEKQLDCQREEQKAAMWSLEDQLRREELSDRPVIGDSAKAKVAAIVEEERRQYSAVLKNIELLQKTIKDVKEEKAVLQRREKKRFIEMNKIGTAQIKVTRDVSKLKKEKKKLEDRIRTAQDKVAEEEALRQRLATVSAECQQKSSEASQLEAEIQVERSRRYRLLGYMQAAARIVRPIVKASEKVTEGDPRIQRLKEILERTDPEDTGSIPDDSENSSSSEPESEETQRLAKDPMFLMLSIRPGEMFYRPPPTWENKPPISRTGSHAVRPTQPLSTNDKAGASTSDKH